MKINIESDGTSERTKIRYADNGERVGCVQRIKITGAVHEPFIAELDICVGGMKLTNIEARLKNPRWEFLKAFFRGYL